MKSVVVIVSLMCLFAVTHLSYGLFCHSCKSTSYAEPACRVIVDNRFLKLCSLGERCGEVFYILKTGPSQVYRLCVTNKLLSSLRDNYYRLESSGVRIGIYMCDTDGCNRRYNLRTMRQNYTLH